MGRTLLIAVYQSTYLNPHRIRGAKLLLENGADVNARNSNGITAAEMLLRDEELREETKLKQLLARIETR